MDDIRTDHPAEQDERILSPRAFVLTIGRMLDMDLSGIATASDVSIAGNWSLDSLQMLEAALAIEELTGSLVSEDEAAALGTVSHAYALYRRLCLGGGVPPGPPSVGNGALRSAGQESSRR